MSDKRTALERVQERVENNYDYISYMCEQYHKDYQAWAWRSDFWIDPKFNRKPDKYR